jgi:hypothetical protein
VVVVGEPDEPEGPEGPEGPVPSAAVPRQPA